MKIGELAQLTNVSIPTIRYYVSLGLLVPVRDSFQYHFREEDYQALRQIVQLKYWGFQLDEIHRILSMKRFAVGVEPKERIDYLNLLIARYQELEKETAVMQKKMNEIQEEIARERNCNFEKRHTGVPLRALSILCCPHCGGDLQLGNVSMNTRYIYEGSLYCRCGYQANVKNGILYPDQIYEHMHDKADTERSLYRECPSELVSLVQKSYNWIKGRLNQMDLTGDEVIMETHLNSFFYLYNNLDVLGPRNLCIIQDKFSEIVEMYKSYMEQMNLDLNILYLAMDGKPPIKENVVDVLIDYNSTNESGIFSSEHYLKQMKKYLKRNGKVVGTYFYFDPASRSIRKLRSSYPNNHPENYTLKYFKDGVQGNYSIKEQVIIGTSLNSGDGVTFSFHETGERIFLNSFSLESKEESGKS